MRYSSGGSRALSARLRTIGAQNKGVMDPFLKGQKETPGRVFVWSGVNMS